MGRGNTLPESSNDYEMFYVDIPTEEDPVDEFYNGYKFYDDLVKTVQLLLDKRTYTPIHNCWHGNNEKIIASSKTLNVLIKDNEWSFAIIIQAKSEKIYPKSFNSIIHLKEALYNLGYSIYERSGPWMSSKWEPEKKVSTDIEVKK